MRDITIVVSEQVLSFAMDVADRLLVIEGGQLVHESTRRRAPTRRASSSFFPSDLIPASSPFIHHHQEITA